MMTEKQTAGKIPSILALIFVTLHVSAFIAVTVLQFRHVHELERNLSARRAEISELTDSCGKGRHRQQGLHVFKRSLDELARKNVDFEVTWKLINSRQASSVSSLMSSVLQAQEQQLIQKCSGDVKICLSGVAGNPGAKGDKGLPGSKGDPGAQGPAGLQGPVGLKGDHGASGTPGTKGVSGAKGSEGPQGWKGETGRSGSKGLTGPSGAQGPTGGKGDVGERGEEGMKGLKGIPGRKGKPGADGRQGPVGLKGETGDPGPKGVDAVYTGPVCDCIDKPYLSTSPDVISGTLGASLDLSCLADGSSPSTVTWYKISEPGCKVNGTSGNMLSIANLEPKDLGRYICVASNSYGNASKTIDVTTNDSLNVLDCNFENQTICHWTESSANKMVMMVTSGKNKTQLFDLTVDHTLGTVSGRYLYFDTSMTLASQSSRIESMTVPANQDHCFTAWYNMYGRDIGSLQIYKKNCNNDPEQLLWSKVGNQGKGWEKVSVSLPAEPGNGFKIIIQANAGVGIQGDIAIDDLSLTNGTCAIPLPVIAGAPNVSMTTTIGSAEVLKCNATGVPSPTVTWAKPTSCLPFTQAGTSHSINPVTFADGGKYTCTATSTAGNTTKEIILKINGSLNCDFEKHDLCGWTSETVNHPDTWLFHSGNTASSHTGPNNDHTTGSSRGVYLYMEASGRSPNDTVVLVSPNLPALNDVCLKFWYNMNGQEINSLNVYTKDCHGVKKRVLSYVGNKGEAWQEGCTKVGPQSYEYNLLIEGVVGSGYLGDIAIDDLELSTDNSCSCRAVDDPCDFENGLCSWVQDKTDNFDWTLNHGPTSSLDTGPSGDHTTGTGNYLYVESSSPQRSGQQAKLVSPVLSPGQSHCLDFWYHMYGINMGTLTIYTQKADNHAKLHTLDSQSGNQGNIWKHRRLTVPAEQFPFEIVFTGTVGTDYTGDVALDDVILSSGSC